MLGYPSFSGKTWRIVLLGHDADPPATRQESQLSQYERERNARIAANRQLLVDLGLASAIRLRSRGA